MCSGSVLVWPRMLPETTDTAPNSPIDAGVAQHRAVEQRPADVRQRHREEGLPGRGAERDRGLLVLAALRLHQRDQLARHEGRGDEQRGQHDRRHGEHDLHAAASQRRAEQALQAVDEEIGDAGDDRRDREGYLDDDEQQGLPRKSNLAIAQAAATPKTMLTGTAITAVTTVSKIAWSVSGCAIVAAKTAEPCENAWSKMSTSGARIRNAPTISTERDQRTADAGLSPTRGGFCDGALMSRLCVSAAPAPACRLVTAEHDEGGDQQHRGDRRRRPIVELLEPDEDRAAR